MGLLVSRQNIHIDYGVLGSSDLDQASIVAAKLQTAIILPLLYPLIHDGKFKNRTLQKRMDRRNEQAQGSATLLDMLGGARPYITKQSCSCLLYTSRCV